MSNDKDGIDSYYNPVHGLELYPNINTGDRNNENGILFLVEYLLMDGKTLSSDYKFMEVLRQIQVAPGLYNRGGMDDQIATETNTPKREISHDNISAVASGSYYLGTWHGKDVSVYGLKHFFSYNNRQKGFRFPMNPGNWSIWLALGKVAPLLQALFFPFFFINFLITTAKSAGETSGKLLYFVELYPLRDHTFWGVMYAWFRLKMVQMYGDRPMVELTKIYFKDEQHPVRLAAIRFEDSYE